MAAKSRKIPMVKREDKKQLLVSFTKRRQGLFNKAAELFTLCDAQLAVFVSSPSNNPKRKVYSFGHPSVDQVLDAFLENRLPNLVNYEYGANQQYALSLSNEIKAMEAELNGKNKKVENLDFEFFENSKSVEELEALVDALQELTKKAKSRFCNNNSSVSPDVASNENSLLDDSPPTSTALTTSGYWLCPPSTRPCFAKDISPTTYM